MVDSSNFSVKTLSRRWRSMFDLQYPWSLILQKSQKSDFYFTKMATNYSFYSSFGGWHSQSYDVDTVLQPDADATLKLSAFANCNQMRLLNDCNYSEILNQRRFEISSKNCHRILYVCLSFTLSDWRKSWILLTR